jgi:hypothetical protein
LKPSEMFYPIQVESDKKWELVDGNGGVTVDDKCIQKLCYDLWMVF